MDYKSESTPSTTNLKNVAKYTLQFENPPVVLVKEEYLIYDTVSMISAIGGTLGICIGISFYHLATQALGWIKIGINQLKTNGRQPCETKTAKKVPTEKRKLKPLEEIGQELLNIRSITTNALEKLDNLELILQRTIRSQTERRLDI